VSWFKKVIKQFIKEDHEETDQFEAAEKSEARPIQNEWNNDWKKEVDSKIMYQYPKGKFRFPVISDEEVGIPERQGRQEPLSERRQNGQPSADRHAQPEVAKQNGSANTKRQAQIEEGRHSGSLYGTRKEQPSERKQAGDANAGRQERPIERRQFGSANENRNEFQTGRRQSPYPNKPETPTERRPSSDAVHSRLKPRETTESSPKSYQSKMPFKPTEIPSPIYGYNRPSVDDKPKMEAPAFRPALDSSDFLTSIMRRKAAEQAAFKAEEQKQEGFNAGKIMLSNSVEETKVELTAEVIEKKAEHLLTEALERNIEKKQESASIIMPATKLAEETNLPEEKLEPVAIQPELTATLELAMEDQEVIVEIQQQPEAEEILEVEAVVELTEEKVLQEEEQSLTEAENYQESEAEGILEAEVEAVVELTEETVLQEEEQSLTEAEAENYQEPKAEEILEAEVAAVVELTEEKVLQEEEQSITEAENYQEPEAEEILEAEMAAVVELREETVLQEEEQSITEAENYQEPEAEEILEAEVAAVVELIEETVLQEEEQPISKAEELDEAESAALLDMEEEVIITEEMRNSSLNTNEKNEAEQTSHSSVAVEVTESLIEKESAETVQSVEQGQQDMAEEKDASPAKKKALPFNVLMLNTDRKSLENKRKQQQISTPTPNVKPEPVNHVPEETAAAIESVTAKEELPYYVFPEDNLLTPPVFDVEQDGWIEEQTELLNHTFKNFNVHARVVNVTQGPSVTRYEVQPEPGVKVSKVTNLSDDLKLSLAAKDIRIEAPIPGKHTIGIEVPNRTSRPVLLSEILNSNEFKESSSPLTVALGLDISGKPIVTDLRKMPHGLIAGATGSGKSVCINTMLVSLLYKAKPEELKLLLIDPKMVELAPYNYIPHLASPVITDVKTATAALKWAVEEMERRYELLAHAGVRDITKFNQLADEHHQYADKLPYIVIIIDELADLMMMAPADVEEAISRIAQKARACGIHLLIATQRPSVDVITGLIKANVPTRIAFSVSSQIDSRTVIDISGAEKLLGKGDMLFLENGTSKPVRLQGTFVSDEEIDQVVAHARKERKPEYLFEQEELLKKVQMSEEEDELFYEACEFVIEQGGASTSSLQRNFKIGYNRAARLIDMMEKHGYISEAKGTKPRDVLISQTEFLQLHDMEQH